MTIRAIDLQRLVNRYGEPLTLVVNTFGAYNPTTGAYPSTSESIPLIGYMATYDLGEIDGVNVIRGDRKCILGNRDSNGDTISPEPGDQIEGSGDTVTIVSVGKIMSNGVVICYVCQVRE